MKKLLLLAVFIVFTSTNIFSQAIPKQIDYQGVLKTSAGTIVPDGNYQLTFRIYNDPTGGTPLWSEAQTVAVANGIFSAHLGSITPITTVPFNRIHFLGITIGADPELSPRTLLTPSPYSFMAINVMDNTVVKSLNSLKDDVNLVAGSNITITPSGNNITISAAGGGGGTVTQINTGAGLTGGPITTTGTISVANEGITSVMLQNNSVTTDKIVDGTISTNDLANNSVTSTKIADGTIVTSDLSDNSVTTAKVVDGTITATDIGSTQVVKSLNAIKDNVNLVAGTNITITPSGQNITIASTAGGVGGSGTANYLPRFTAATTLGNSSIFQSGTNIGIGTTSPLYQLHVISSSANVIIYGEYTGTGAVDGVGVYGKSVPADFYGYGGYFVGGFKGVEGIVVPTGNSNYYGVNGRVEGGGGYNYALRGYASGTGTKYGVRCFAEGTGINYGIYSSVSGGTTNIAGYFAGNVNVTGTLSKGGGSFKIDHPLDPQNKYLYHSFVESPDMMNIYNGNIVTDGSGYATVNLPDWFEALNKDFRYQLTVISDFAQAIIAQEVQGNQFAIRTDKPNVKVSWQVTGIRKDAFAEKNRIPVEELKQGDDVGKYLHPEAYGLPETMGIDYERNNPDMKRNSK